MGWYKPTVEVPLLFMFFSYEVVGPVQTNLLIYRTCYIILGYNESECALLGNSNNSTIENLEKLVEPMANIVDTTKSMMEQVVALIFCIFAGQWSDKFGRKPLLIVTQLGMLLGFFIMSIITYFPNISPWYFLFASVPPMLTGSFSTFLVATLSYVSDSTTEETRGVRMAVVEGTIGIGILCGNSLSSYLFYATNYSSVYAIAGALVTLGLIYTIFFVPESLEHVETEEKTTMKDIFKSFNLKELMRVFTKERPKYNRAIIFLMTGILTIYIFTQSTGNKTFLFLRGKFNWTLTQYTLYNSVSTLFFVFGGIVGTMVLHKRLKFTESVTILMGLLSEVNGFLVRGLATRSRDIYFSGCVKLLGGIISPQSRTLVAKLVPTDEIAKLFSLITVIEFVVGLAAQPFFTAVYNSTVNIDPAIYNFAAAGINCVSVILIITIIVLENWPLLKYSQLNNAEDAVSINNSDVMEVPNVVGT